MPTEFDYGDASATLSGMRGAEPPYTPICQTSGGPNCILATVREVMCLKPFWVSQWETQLGHTPHDNHNLLDAFSSFRQRETQVAHKAR